MLEWICAIPEHIGWIIVGMLLCLCLEMGGLVLGTIITAIKERLEDDEDEE